MMDGESHFRVLSVGAIFFTVHTTIENKRDTTIENKRGTPYVSYRRFVWSQNKRSKTFFVPPFLTSDGDVVVGVFFWHAPGLEPV